MKVKQIGNKFSVSVDKARVTARDNRKWPITITLSDGSASTSYKFEIQITYSEEEQAKPDFFIPIIEPKPMPVIKDDPKPVMPDRDGDTKE